jgi:hypothetical protein
MKHEERKKERKKERERERNKKKYGRKQKLIWKKTTLRETRRGRQCIKVKKGRNIERKTDPQQE